ncbi:MAG TPA: diaminopimelate decarboxylase [Methylomirabilota bacterium]|nr:diaminopimelate decarboxylase [Methylomirabilota bacterium]
MSSSRKARKHLSYIDPAEFTPHFAWRTSPRGPGRIVACEGIPLDRIAARFGTPLYVYSESAVRDAFNELKRGLGGVPHLLCFAVKANGNLSILNLLAKLGSGFDIVSGGELDHLGHIAIPGNRIVFSGVGKTREEIRSALNYRARRSDAPGILQFNVESPDELDSLLLEASRRHRSAPVPGVSVRVNPDVAAGGHPHISTGLAHHKFGVSWNDARALYLQRRHAPHIRWQGISAHIGSQIVDLAPFREALSRLAGYVVELRKQDIALDYLDFGGGLGVRYTTEKPVLRIDYARMVAKTANSLGMKLLLEPGRSIIASSAVLLARVLFKKRNSTRSFVVLDAAMNDFARPVLYDAPHPITVVRQSAKTPRIPKKRFDLVGPVCESGDTFLYDWPLGEVQPGDVVAIWGAGAYGMVQSSNYNGRRRPAEVLVKGQSARLIRRRETLADLLRTDVLA